MIEFILILILAIDAARTAKRLARLKKDSEARFLSLEDRLNEISRKYSDPQVRRFKRNALRMENDL